MAREYKVAGDQEVAGACSCSQYWLLMLKVLQKGGLQKVAG